MTAMEEDVDDRFAGIDIDSLLNRTDHRPLSYGRKKALYEAPEFVQRFSGEETVMEGQSLCLECKVRGFPVPTLRWFKDDEEILDHPRIHVESNGTGGYSLIIDKVNKGDEAAYRCRAENVEGACSCFFFLSVKGKPKNKKKDQKSSPNRRTVSFPPMFATIVEKVEEEEKQGREFESLPPSPMTDFYYALTLKGRQSWPTFVGDWAFVNGGHSHKRRTDGEGDEPDSSPATTAALPNGDYNDKFLSPNQARLAARRSLRRSELAARAEAKKQRLQEEGSRSMEIDEETRLREEKEKKRLEEESQKKEDEMRIDIERKRRAETMRMRKKAREERLQKEKEGEKVENANKENCQKINERDRDKLQSEKQKQEERDRLEEENKKRDEQRQHEEIKKKEEEKRKQDERKKKEEERNTLEEENRKRDQQRQLEEIKKKEEEKRKQEERKKQEEENKLRQEKDRKKQEDMKRKTEAEELARKREEERQQLRHKTEMKKQEEAKKHMIEEERKQQGIKRKIQDDELRDEEKKLEGEQSNNKKTEEKLRFENETKAKDLTKAFSESNEAKPGRQRSVLQKFAKHLDSKLEPCAVTVSKPAIINYSAEKSQSQEQQQNLAKSSDIISIDKAKSTQTCDFKEDKIQQELRKPQMNEKGNGIPKGFHTAKKDESRPNDAKTGKKISDETDSKKVLLKSWQERESLLNKQGIFQKKSLEEPKDQDQKRAEESKQEQKRMEEMKQQEQRRIEELKQQEQRRMEERKQQEQKQIRLEEIKQQEQRRLEDLKRQEQKRMEEMKQQEQRRMEENKLHEQRRLEDLKRQEQKRMEEMNKQEQRRLEELKRQEQKRMEEIKQQEQRRLEDMKRQERKRMEEMKQQEQRRMEEKKQQEHMEKLKQQDHRRMEEVKQQEQRRMEDLKRQEQKRMEEMKKQEQRRLEELKRQEQKRMEEMKQQEQRRMEDLKRQEQKRMEELKKQEQKRMEETKQQEQKRAEGLKQGRKTEDLRAREKIQIEEMRQKEQTQREELAKKEQKQREELRRKEEKQKEEMKLKQDLNLKERMKRSDKIMLQEEIKRKEEIKPKEEINRNEQKNDDGKRISTTVKQNMGLKTKEITHKEELGAKEQKQIKEMKFKESKQIEDLRINKQIEDLRIKRPQMRGPQPENDVKRKEDKDKEDLRREYKKEQMRKEQLWRQHEEEVEKRQKLNEEAKQRRERDKQRELDSSENDEFQVKVHKRDYSFEELRKSLEAQVGGQVMDTEEHKYWDDILEKHDYSICDLRKAFDPDPSQNMERRSRMRVRRNNTEDTELSRMKRSSSLTDRREAFTNSLERPKKKSEDTEKRQKDEEFLKRRPSITELRQQFTENVKSQAESKRPQHLLGQREADITIRRLRAASPFSHFEGSRRSKSPTPFRLSPSPGASQIEQTEEQKPVSRTQAELSKIASTVAAKRASFHELLSQNQAGSSSPNKAQKRMSFPVRDAYGSREIPIYKRAAGWSDDVDKSQTVRNPDDLKKSEVTRALDSQNSNSPSSIRNSSEVTTNLESSSWKVRPFVYNSARTTARNSTGSDSCDYSTDDGVFGDDNYEMSFHDEFYNDSDGRPPLKKAFFYIENTNTRESDTSPTKNFTVNNSKVLTDDTKVSTDESCSQNKQNYTESHLLLTQVMDKDTDVEICENTELNIEDDNVKSYDQAKANSALSGDILTLPHNESVMTNESDTYSENSYPFDGISDQREVSSFSQKLDRQPERKQQPGSKLCFIHVIIDADDTGSSSIDDKGGAAPKITVEACDESDTQESCWKQNLQLQQPSSLSSPQTQHVQIAEECLREEREATPFFRSSATGPSDFHNSSLRGVGTSSDTDDVSSDGARTEGEPTPYFDENFKQQNVTVARGDKKFLGKNLSADPNQEFHREPTPFCEDTTKKKSASRVQSLTNTSLVEENRILSQRDKTLITRNPAQITSDLASITVMQSSLAVPSFSEQNRDARESTPFYTQSDPYEYIHHPDHHFTEKKSVLVKQNSKEADNNQFSQTLSLCSPPDILLPFSIASEQASQLQSLPNSLPALAVNTTSKLLTDDLILQPENMDGITATEQRGGKKSRSLHPVILESQKTKTMEIKRDSSSSTASTVKSPVLRYGEKHAPNNKQLPAILTLFAGNNNHSNETENPSTVKAYGVSKAHKKATKEPSTNLEETSAQKQSDEPLITPTPVIVQAKLDSETRKENVEVIRKKSTGHQPNVRSILLTSQDMVALKRQLSTQSQASATASKTPKEMLLADANDSLIPLSEETSSSRFETEVLKILQLEKQPISDHKTQAVPFKVAKRSETQLDLQTNLVGPGKLFPPSEDPSKSVVPTKVSPTSINSASDLTKSVKSTAQLQPPSQADILKASSSKDRQLMVSLTKPISADLRTLRTPDSVLTVKGLSTIEQVTVQKQVLSPISTLAATSEAPASKMPCVDLLTCPQTSQERNEPLQNETAMRRQLLVSAIDIYPVEIFSSVSTTGTPPADTAMKRKNVKSTFSGAFSKIFKHKSKMDEQNYNSNAKEKQKKRILRKETGKKQATTTQPLPCAETNLQVSPGVVSRESLAKHSPFGPYTLEGFCFLLVLTIFCLYLDMSIEKSMCYILASFYTFCVMRILGVIQ